MDKLANIHAAICRYYDREQVVSGDLIEAIRYSIESGGKCIRPLFLLEMLEAFGLTLTQSHFDVAASVELIHTGSLIHDDLPAMDNDDFRRGRLTNHKKFNEATAILAGDSLFLDAFALVARSDLSAEAKVALIAELSLASGTFGMVGGQMLDMNGEGKSLTIEELKTIHANKTGQLLTFPFVAAGIIAEQSSDVLESLRRAGQLIGFAFQVRDDLLDVTATFDEIGKTPNKDVLVEKSTYPALLGLDQSYHILDDSLNQASAIFRYFQEKQGFKADKVIEMVERLRLHA